MLPCVAVKVLASYPYAAQNEDELTFQQGDIISIVSREDPDWWTGQLAGITGVFPANYVQHYTEPCEWIVLLVVMWRCFVAIRIRSCPLRVKYKYVGDNSCVLVSYFGARLSVLVLMGSLQCLQ